ncbi:hybrid sensor histidine kinase/response regulator [Pseudomonas sp. o96-267]|uniref:ATP-binding response regulator n=1 Tax=Pseudomonas sp. o96-267 TaxID=2479853 RepID=UPI001C499D26|nr:hybrid sensor histidine kinase/response regulator [Pseudomonas sp. o96-267]
MTAETPKPSPIAPERIRVEQLRLLLGAMKSSIAPGVLLVVLLGLTLYDTSHPVALGVWCIAVLTGRIGAVVHARYVLAHGLEATDPQGTARWLFWLNIYDAAAWCSLVWIALANAGLSGSILIMASIAGITANAMLLLAPVRPVYLGFAMTGLCVIGSGLLALGDPTYYALATACVLYAFGINGQTKHSHDEARNSIILRFENLELIERLREATDRAEADRDRAEQANLAKSKFLAAASHDLRQPVHAQELFLEVLSRSELQPPQREVLQSARAASQASAQMLNTLLDFSRIEAGVIEPQRKAFGLQPLLNKLEAELGYQADAKDIVYRCRETSLAVYSDPALLELMLRNLIANAIRYTEHGGILIGCRRSGQDALIDVYDTGIGIAPEQQLEVFREFHQLGNPERDRRKGLGLGLAITDGLARSLGHHLTLRSRPGSGSLFRVRLPLARGNFIEDTFENTASLPQVASTKLAGRRILVLDDDEAVRQGMQQLLGEWGCQCRAAETITDALALLEEWAPELLVSDYRLRESHTGAQAIEMLRQAQGHSVPALLITGDTATQRLREATASGIPLLHKPVSPAQLYRALLTSLK